MKVDKHYDPEDIFPRHWKRLCESCGIGYPGFRRTFLDLAKRISGKAEELRDELDEHADHRETFNSILDYVGRNAQLIEKRFASEKEKEPPGSQRDSGTEAG
jgi:hypothetical protein